MRALFQGRPFYFGLICFCTKTPNLTADYTDNTDLRGSKKFQWNHFNL